MYYNRSEMKRNKWNANNQVTKIEKKNGDLCPGLAALEKQDSHLTQVEVDKVAGLVGHVGTEVPTNDAVPGGVVLFVELLLDVGGDVLLNVVLLEGLSGAVDCVLEQSRHL